LSSCGEEETKKIQEMKATQKDKATIEAKAQKDALLAELKAKDLALEKARKETQNAQAKLLAQEQEKKEAFLKEQRQKEKEIKQIAQNEKLSHVGINIDNNKITIDTDKTKDFFKKLGQNFEDKIKKVTQDIEKGIIDQKDAGVKIDHDTINIDLNKTKDFLELWGKKMQGFVKEFDTMAKEIDTANKGN
jgi:hypothetical protein